MKLRKIVQHIFTSCILLGSTETGLVHAIEGCLSIKGLGTIGEESSTFPIYSAYQYQTAYTEVVNDLTIDSISVHSVTDYIAYGGRHQADSRLPSGYNPYAWKADGTRFDYSASAKNYVISVLRFQAPNSTDFGRHQYLLTRVEGWSMHIRHVSFLDPPPAEVSSIPSSLINTAANEMMLGVVTVSYQAYHLTIFKFAPTALNVATLSVLKTIDMNYIDESLSQHYLSPNALLLNLNSGTGKIDAILVGNSVSGLGSIDAVHDVFGSPKRVTHSYDDDLRTNTLFMHTVRQDLLSKPGSSGYFWLLGTYADSYEYNPIAIHTKLVDGTGAFSSADTTEYYKKGLNSNVYRYVDVASIAHDNGTDKTHVFLTEGRNAFLTQWSIDIYGPVQTVRHGNSQGEPLDGVPWALTCPAATQVNTGSGGYTITCVLVAIFADTFGAQKANIIEWPFQMLDDGTYGQVYGTKRRTMLKAYHNSRSKYQVRAAQAIYLPSRSKVVTFTSMIVWEYYSYPLSTSWNYLSFDATQTVSMLHKDDPHWNCLVVSSYEEFTDPWSCIVSYRDTEFDAGPSWINSWATLKRPELMGETPITPTIVDYGTLYDTWADQNWRPPAQTGQYDANQDWVPSIPTYQGCYSFTRDPEELNQQTSVMYNSYDEVQVAAGLLLLASTTLGDNGVYRSCVNYHEHLAENSLYGIFTYDPSGSFGSMSTVNSSGLGGATQADCDNAATQTFCYEQCIGAGTNEFACYWRAYKHTAFLAQIVDQFNAIDANDPTQRPWQVRVYPPRIDNTYNGSIIRIIVTWGDFRSQQFLSGEFQYDATCRDASGNLVDCADPCFEDGVDVCGAFATVAQDAATAATTAQTTVQNAADAAATAQTNAAASAAAAATSATNAQTAAEAEAAAKPVAAAAATATATALTSTTSAESAAATASTTAQSTLAAANTAYAGFSDASSALADAQTAANTAASQASTAATALASATTAKNDADTASATAAATAGATYVPTSALEATTAATQAAAATTAVSAANAAATAATTAKNDADTASSTSRGADNIEDAEAASITATEAKDAAEAQVPIATAAQTAAQTAESAAATAAAAAETAAQATIAAQTTAETAATTAQTAQTTAETASTTALAAQAAAEAALIDLDLAVARAQAAAAAQAASTAEATAQSSSTAAATAETNAVASSNAAATSAANAQTAADALVVAQLSASVSATAADTALTSTTSASTAAAAASTTAQSTLAAANTAYAGFSDASSALADAQTAANTAASQASTAATALASATTAKNDADTASATAAAATTASQVTTSATEAANAASEAGTSTQAVSDANAAATAANNAKTDAVNASTTANAAGTVADAETAAAAAVAAKAVAEAQEAIATAAKTTAETSETAAATAATEAETQSQSAIAAQTTAETAATTAQTAQTTAETASTTALAAQAAAEAALIDLYLAVARAQAAAAAQAASTAEATAQSSSTAAATAETNAVASSNAAATSAANAQTVADAESETLLAASVSATAAAMALTSATDAWTALATALATAQDTLAAAIIAYAPFADSASALADAQTAADIAATETAKAASEVENVTAAKAEVDTAYEAVAATSAAAYSATSATEAANAASEAGTSTQAVSDANAAATAANNAKTDAVNASTTANAAGTVADAETAAAAAVAAKAVAEAQEAIATAAKTTAETSETAAATAATEAETAYQAAIVSQAAQAPALVALLEASVVVEAALQNALAAQKTAEDAFVDLALFLALAQSDAEAQFAAEAAAALAAELAAANGTASTEPCIGPFGCKAPEKPKAPEKICVGVKGETYPCSDACYNGKGVNTCEQDPSLCYDDIGQEIACADPCIDQDGNDICTSKQDESDNSLLTTVPLEEVSDSLQSLFTEDMSAFNDAVGALLGVDNVEEAIGNQQKVMKVSDETSYADLAKAASFDLNGFAASLGFAGFVPKTPDFVLQKNMTRSYVVPSNAGMDPQSTTLFNFETSYAPQSIEGMLEGLSKGKKDSDKKRALQNLETDGNGGAALETGVDLSQLQKLSPMSQILKISESLKCTLVPANDNYLDKKGFTWELYVYEGSKLGLKYTFEYPEYISVGELDTMKVEFNNTAAFVPTDTENFLTMPSGYTITMKIPPQGTNLLTQEETKSRKATAQTLVITNLIMSLLLKQVMAMVLGSIVVVQILAHLPLADIYLPANAQQQFDIMISFVSFDYFSPGDYIDFGFTEVPPWSERFDWLGYGSVNFVDGMGSIIIFAGITIFQLVLSVLLNGLRHCTGRNFLPGRLLLPSILGGSLGFIHGVFFEVLVCVSISVKMLEYGEFLNDSDWVSLYLAAFFGLILLIYIAFLVYFSCVSKKMVDKAQGTKNEEKQEMRRSVQKELIRQRTINNPERKEEVRKVMKLIRMDSVALTEKASKIDEAQFEKFAPLVENMRPDSLLATFNNTFITVRRLLMLYMAMFIIGQQWLQVLTFMTMNVLSMCYLLIAFPFDSKLMNFLSLFNEASALVISYFIAQINDMKYDPKTAIVIGDYIIYSIYTSWAINGLIIFSVALNENYQKLRRLYYTKLRFKYACLRPKTKNGDSDLKKRDRFPSPLNDEATEKQVSSPPKTVLKPITEENSYSYYSEESEEAPASSGKLRPPVKRTTNTNINIHRPVVNRMPATTLNVIPDKRYEAKEVDNLVISDDDEDDQEDKLVDVDYATYRKMPTQKFNPAQPYNKPRVSSTIKRKISNQEKIVLGLSMVDQRLNRQFTTHHEAATRTGDQATPRDSNRLFRTENDEQKDDTRELKFKGKSFSFKPYRLN